MVFLGHTPRDRLTPAGRIRLAVRTYIERDRCAPRARAGQQARHGRRGPRVEVRRPGLHGNELVLGPFVGKPSPHTRIPVGRGICGAAAAEKATIVVDDVNADPRYLACSLETRSEIVVPIMADGEVLGEIDIDSDRPAAFGAADRELLEAVAGRLAPRLAARS